MLGEWYRVGDLFECADHEMRFRNGHHSIIIKEIHITWNFPLLNDEFIIFLLPSESHRDLFFQLIKKHYPEEKSYQDHINFPVTLSSETDLNRLKSFFAAINTEKEQIPQKLIRELEKLYANVQMFLRAYLFWLQLIDADLYNKLRLAEMAGDTSALQKHQMLHRMFYNVFYERMKNDLFSEEKYSISEIKEEKQEYEVVDFIYSTSEEKLNTELKMKRDREQEKQIARFCAHGRSPNILIKNNDKSNFPLDDNNLLLHVAIKAGRVGVVKILLSYGADPRIRFGYFYKSPLEDILISCELDPENKTAYEMRDVINWVSSKLRAPIDNLFTVKSMRVINLQPLHNALMTNLVLSNSKSLCSYLVKANFKLPNDPSKLTAVWKNVFKVFCKYFKFRHNKSYEAFKDNFGLNKYAELIYAENQLVGFNFFETIIPKNKNYFFQYNAYSGLEKEYRGYRIGTLLGFRMAFCLQQIFSSRKGGIFFFSVDYNSFRAAEMFEPYPKFLTPASEKFIENDILPHFLQPKEFHKSDGIMRYIYDESKCVSSTSETNDPSAVLFKEHILGLNQEVKPKNDIWMSRSAPVFFSTTTDNLRKISNSLGKINVDFQDHIKELKTFLNNNENKQEIKTPCLRGKL